MPHSNYCVLCWKSQTNRIHLLQKRAIRNINNANYRAHSEPIFKSLNVLKIDDIYYLSILKFYSKLINNNLPHYFDSFKPQFANGVLHYNLRKPSMQLPINKHEFPRQSLRYKLITTLNEMSAEAMELAKNYTQKRFVDLVRNNIANGYRNTCVDPRNCYTTHNINVYILITKHRSRYFNYIKMFYYIHVTICILIHSEYFLYGWHVTV